MSSTSNIASRLFNKSKKRTNNSPLITDRNDETPDDFVSGVNNEMDIDHEQKFTNVVHSVLKIGEVKQQNGVQSITNRLFKPRKKTKSVVNTQHKVPHQHHKTTYKETYVALGGINRQVKKEDCFCDPVTSTSPVPVALLPPMSTVGPSYCLASSLPTVPLQEVVARNGQELSKL